MEKIVATLKHQPFMKQVMHHYRDAEVAISSIAVAYYLILTIFPFLVLLANLFPYFHIDTNQLLTFLKANLPAELYHRTAGLVLSVFDKPSTSLLWLAIVTGIWTMSRSMLFLEKAMNKAYGVKEHRDVVLGYLVGMLSSLLIVFFLVLAILLSTFGKTALRLLYQQMHFKPILYHWLMYLTQPVTALVFFIALSVLYFILPNVKIHKIRYVLPGSCFATLVFMIFTSLFGSYVNYTIDRMENLRIFGSVTVFAIMLWVIFFARILIDGAVLNASYQACSGQPFETRRDNVIQIIQSRREERQ